MATIILLSDTLENIDFIGNPTRTDDYRTGYQEITIFYTSFVGKIYIEASLSQKPIESDWFPIYLHLDKPYLELPDDDMEHFRDFGSTGKKVYKIKGKFSFMRARIERSYLGFNPTDINQVKQLGTINNIILTY